MKAGWRIPHRSDTSKTRYWLASSIFLAMLLAACGGSESNGESPAAGGCADGDSTGVTDSEIVIGYTSLLTGTSGYIGQEANDAYNVVIDEVNEAGGVLGRQIRVVTYDDAYDVSKALPAARRLVEEDQIFAWTGGLGTPTFVSVLPLLEEAGVPSIAMYAPAEDIGTMDHPLVFMPWTNFIDEYEGIASYLSEEESMADDRVAFVHYDSDAGRDALKGTQQALDAAGAELVEVISVPTDEEDWASIAVDLRATEADWVGMQIIPVAGGQLLEAMADIGYTPGTFGQSDFIDEAFLADYATIANDRFWTALKTRPFDDPAVDDIVADLEEALGTTPTQWHAIGYTQAKIVVAALEAMEEPTRECLIEALESLDGVETGFLPPVSFGPENRQGVTAIGVAKISNGEFEVVKPFE